MVYDVRDDTLMTGNGGMENGSAWPRTRFGSLDVLADVPHELSAQIGDGGEDATGDDVLVDPGEPQFDLVEPGRVSRREVQPDTTQSTSRCSIKVPLRASSETARPVQRASLSR